MTRFVATVVMWAVVFFLLAFGACSLLNPTTGEEQIGLPTSVTADVLRGIADDVELWDIDKDGRNTDQELVALGFAVVQRLMVAWQQNELESGLVDRDGAAAVDPGR